MKQNFRNLLIALFLVCISPASLADSDSEGCKSCVRSHDCSRINKTCNATCRANLYSKKIDLESCRGRCIGDLERCLSSAKKSCGFYCAEK